MEYDLSFTNILVLIFAGFALASIIIGLVSNLLIQLGKLHTESAFVAMWFDDSMKETYEEAIKPAIEETGYEPVRVDRIEHNGKTDDEIIKHIRSSKFIIADFSQGKEGARGSVYYEAGFAHGLDIPVIFTCRKKDKDDLHFNTRQFNHIIWENAADLRKQLINRIGSTVGQGPISPS